MILVANKVDLVHLRKVTEEQGRELAAQLKVCAHLCRLKVIDVILVRLWIKDDISRKCWL